MPTKTSPWRRGLTIGSLCIAGALAAAVAQPAASKPAPKATPQPTAVAIVDLTKVINGLQEGVVAKQKLNDQVSDYSKRLQELKDRREKVNKDLEMLKDKKETPEYMALLADKFELEATLKARADALQQLIDLNEGETVRMMYNKIVAAATQIGKEAGYDMILTDDRYIEPPANKTGAQVTAVIRDRRILYATERVDITADVITRMNNEFKAGK